MVSFIGLCYFISLVVTGLIGFWDHKLAKNHLGGSTSTLAISYTMIKRHV